MNVVSDEFKMIDEPLKLRSMLFNNYRKICR